MGQFAAHGNYAIRWEGEVMILTLGNLFNREGGEQVLWNVADQLQKRGDRPWAILADVREWQGGTPDAYDFWLTSINIWITQKQLVAFAALFAGGAQQFMGSSVRAALSGRLPYFSAPDAAACWQWLREQGLAVGKAEL